MWIKKVQVPMYILNEAKFGQPTFIYFDKTRKSINNLKRITSTKRTWVIIEKKFNRM